MFAKEIYIARRQQLLSALKGEQGIILFLGNEESPAQYRDNCYKWRQDSTWLYYFGIDVPHMAATLDLDNGTQTVYGDDPDIDDIVWNGPTPSVAELAAESGVSKTAPYAALADTVRGRKVHFVPMTRYENAVRLGELTGNDPQTLFNVGKRGCPKASEVLVRAIIDQRIVKTPQEIQELDAICSLGQEMHRIARRGIRVGEIEQNIVGAMEGFSFAKGWGVSFPTILTQHGEVFHCHSHACEIAPGKLLVIDAGMESNEHYASDFTRTYPTGGKYTSKQRDIYQIVCDCNEYAFSITKPGITYREVHIATVEMMLSKLAELGLVKGDPAQMAADGIGGLFMPHGLGHNMGLDVHDMEDYGEDLVGYQAGQTRSSQLGLGSLRMARTLKPGHVVTDEPGIYFIPDLIENWRKEGLGKGVVNFDLLRKEYYDFGGIRLEDDVLVTENGARRLGANRLEIQPDDVEAAMAING